MVEGAAERRDIGLQGGDGEQSVETRCGFY